jgi:hypothetical protein
VRRRDFLSVSTKLALHQRCRCAKLALGVPKAAGESSGGGNLAGIDLLVTPFAEEGFEHFGAFPFPHAANNFAAVIQLGVLEDVHDAASSAILEGSTPEDDTAHADVDQGASAHGARFLGDVEIAVGEAPIADDALGLGDGEHFGVGGGVLERFDLVMSAGDDPPFTHNYDADRHFLMFPRAARLTEGFAHEILVALQIDDGFFGH